MIYVLGGGGGLAVPFRVFRGTSAPSSPKAFDLWIKTSTTVSNCQLRNTTYTTSVAGQMVIHYETTIDGNCAATSASPSLFMANEKVNSLLYRMPIKLTACKISTGSGWQSVDAYIYKNSQWVQFSSAWNGELFDSSGQYTNVTGGWTGYDSLSNGVMTVTTGTAKTNNAVSFGSYTTLNFHIVSASGDVVNEPRVGVKNASGSNVATTDGTRGSDITLSVNISELGSGYPFFQMLYGAGYVGTLKVDRVWLS